MRLSKKEQKRYSRLIAAKLTRMLVKNELKMVPFGKRVRRPVLDAEGKLQFNKDNVLMTKVVDILRAENYFRNQVRYLRNQPLAEIEAFLALPEPKPITT